MLKHILSMKDFLLQARNREFPVTVRVLKSYPEGKMELRPGPKSSTAQMLAWTFVVEERLVRKLLAGEEHDFKEAAPDTMAEIVSIYEKEFAKTNKVIENMSEAQLKETAPFYVGPKTPGDVPKLQLALMMLFDCVHHRGQFSVYLRIVEAKVPSIYGPTADEPWT